MRQITCIVLVGISLLLLSCATAIVTDNANSAAVSPSGSSAASTPLTQVATLKPGTELYAQNCMICHKETGKGGRLTLGGKSLNVEDLTEAKLVKATDANLIGYVTNGIEDEGMPAFKDELTADEIKAVVAHVRTLQNK